MKTISFLRTNFIGVVALLMVIITMSFTMTGTKGVDTEYEYNSASTMPGAFGNTSNWKMATSSPSCELTGQRPCRIVVPAGSTLVAQIGGKTNSQVLAIHPTERKP